MLLSRLRLRDQLLGAFVLLALLCAAVGVIGHSGMEESEAYQRNLAEEDLTYILLANEVASDNLQLRRYEKDMAINLGSPAKTGEYRNKFNIVLDRITKDAAELARLTLIDSDLDDAARQTASGLGELITQYSSGVLQAIDESVALTPAQANDKIAAFKEYTHRLEKDTMTLVEAGRKMIRTKAAESAALIARSQRNLLLVNGGVFLLALGAGFLLARSITRPLAAVSASIEELAQGDLRGALDERLLRRRDEIGDLTRSFTRLKISVTEEIALMEAVAEGDWTRRFAKRSPADQLAPAVSSMIEKVSAMILSMRRLAEQLDGHGGELSSAAQGLSQGAVESAASIEQINASMTEIASQAQLNAENAGQTRNLAVAAGKTAQEGDRSMNALSAAMREIIQSNRQIGSIIRTVNDIAFQTHLLALNASVEAARAGRHGNGFAIVATEVGTLAARSTHAAVEITDLIDQSAAKVEKGMEVAVETAKTLQEIVRTIARVNDCAGEIAAAAQEQSHGVGQISAGLGQLDIVTQQNTARAEETSSATEELAALARTLRQQLCTFRVTESVCIRMPEVPAIRSAGTVTAGAWPIGGRSVVAGRPALQLSAHDSGSMIAAPGNEEDSFTVSLPSGYRAV